MQDHITCYCSQLSGLHVIESYDWALQVVKLSTTPTLLVQIKQLLDILPKNQQGGPTLFKLIFDKLNAKTFERTTLLQDYITSFCLYCLPCKNVSLGSSFFKAAGRMPAHPELPTDLFQHYLQVMSRCGNEEFHSICSFQLGFLSTPMYEDSSICKSPDILGQLDIFAFKLESNREAFKASMFGLVIHALIVPSRLPPFLPPHPKDPIHLGSIGLIPRLVTFVGDPTLPHSTMILVSKTAFSFPTPVPNTVLQPNIPVHSALLNVLALISRKVVKTNSCAAFTKPF